MAGEYLVDTNVFITAKNDFYAFDLAPGFWAKMKEQILKGRCCVIDAVDMEIRDGKEEELVQWWLEIRKTYPDIIKRAKENEEVFFCAGFIEKVIYWMRYWQIIDGMHHFHFQKNYFLKMKVMHVFKKWLF